VSELYELFAKFSKSEDQHFGKLEQQRKTSKPDEAPRPPRYNDSQHSYPKQIHNIDSDGSGPPENWEKNFGPPPQERNSRTSDPRFTQYNQRGSAPNRGRGRGRGPYTFRPPDCLFLDSETNHHIKDCPIFLESKRKMDQEFNQPSQQMAHREVNNTMQ
jgi:hypothetical protein